MCVVRKCWNEKRMILDGRKSSKVRDDEIMLTLSLLSDITTVLL